MNDKFELADGRVVTFDELREGDLSQLIQVFNAVVREGIYFHRNEEIPDVETAIEWYQKQMKKGMVFVAAKVNNKFVGGASIEPRKGKASHVGYFGIYIKKEFRNLGIGTRLISKIIEIARQKSVNIIQLCVFASNSRAIHVYKKFGFQEAGRIRNGIEFQDSTHTDEVLMALYLKK